MKLVERLESVEKKLLVLCRKSYFTEGHLRSVQILETKSTEIVAEMKQGYKAQYNFLKA